MVMGDAVFGREYAAQYDLLYRDKDYEAECELLERIFAQYGQGPVRSVLDLGCGTGNHAYPLARRGYIVTGVDRSGAMLDAARRKASFERLEGCIPPSFAQGDVRSVDLGRTFDAVLMMFAVLGYQVADDDLLSALRVVRRHLRPGGLFVCDVWYGPAVLAIRPSERVKTMTVGDEELVRIASGTLDVARHVVYVRYRFQRRRGEQLLTEFNETHVMRYFFREELATFMARAGLRLLAVRDFADLEREPDESSWNIWVIAEVESLAKAESHGEAKPACAS